MGTLEKKLLEEIYYRYGQEIFRYLFILCRDRMLAEDVLQETFCRAVLSLPSGHTNVRAWLYLVGRNLMFNEMKKRRRETPVEDMSEAAYMAQDRSAPDGMRRRRNGAESGARYGTGTGIPSSQGRDMDPEQQALDRERSDILQEAMMSLDVRKREILELTYFEGFTLKESAAVMGISHENARVLSSRARRELRKIMEVKGYEIS